MSEPLATFETINTILGGDLDQSQASRLIDVVSGAIRRYTGQQISAQTNDVYATNGRDGSVIVLPQVPVTDVASVTVDGTALTADDYEWDARGVVEHASGTWSSKRRGVVVTYDHGYSETPDELVGVIASVVGRLLENPSLLRSETIGNYSVTFSQDAGQIFTAGEIEILDSYRIPGFA